MQICLKELALGLLVLVTLCSTSSVYPKLHKHVYTTNFFGSQMGGIKEKLKDTQENLKNALDIVAKSKNKVRNLKKILNAIIDFGNEVKEKYKTVCPVQNGVVDRQRGICLLHRNIRSYARSWGDARQYCLQRGGDLAQPSLWDYTYDDDLRTQFPEFDGALLADVFIGIRALPDSPPRSLNPVEEDRNTSLRSFSYEYFYLNGLHVPSDIQNFRYGSSGDPAAGYVAVLSLPIFEGDGIEINDRLASDLRGFLCQFKLKPHLSVKFKFPINHIDDSVIILPEDLDDVEDPHPESEEKLKEESEEVVPPEIHADFEDEDPDPCADVECAINEICRDGSCVDPCADVLCPSLEICRDGFCVDPCDSVICPPDEICRDGNCFDPCDFVICPPNGEICVNGFCVDPCADVQCPDGENCLNGNCVDPCADVRCPMDEICRDGSCFDRNDCTGVVCPPDEDCLNGLCFNPDPCANVVCPPNGEICLNGICVDPNVCPNPCINGEVCTAGVCGPAPCTNIDDCPDGQVCTPEQVCGGCSNTDQCLGSQVCTGGACGDCLSTLQCLGGQVCTGGACGACTAHLQCIDSIGTVCVADRCDVCQIDDDCDTLGGHFAGTICDVPNGVCIL